MVGGGAKGILLGCAYISLLRDTKDTGLKFATDAQIIALLTKLIAADSMLILQMLFVRSFLRLDDKITIATKGTALKFATDAQIRVVKLIAEGFGRDKISYRFYILCWDN